jgi:hypothetical protein
VPSLLALLALGLVACSRSTYEQNGGSGGLLANAGGAGGAEGGAPGGGGTAGERSCAVAADCAWGEIAKEILVATDCPCLFGCPSLVQNRATLDRRAAQYKALCRPGMNGQGQACPIDDCVQPPALSCTDGLCTAPAKR